MPIDDVRFGEDFQENRIYLYFSWHLIWLFFLYVYFLGPHQQQQSKAAYLIGAFNQLDKTIAILFNQAIKIFLYWICELFASFFKKTD